MAKRKSTEKIIAGPDWESANSTGICCDGAELASAINELSRQVHLLGVIIDELVSEFQWQNNQMAESIRQADGVSKKATPMDAESVEPPCPLRTKLFE